MRVSKFYYSGSLEQVNYLTPKDALLQATFGTWQMMMFEGAALLLFGLVYLAAFVGSIFNGAFLQFLALGQSSNPFMRTFSVYPLDNLFRLGFTGVLLAIAIGFLIVYHIMPEEERGYEKKIAMVYGFVAVFFFLFTNFSLYAVLSIGGFLLVFNALREKGAKRAAMLALIVCVLALLFWPNLHFATVDQRVQCAFAVGVAGIGGFMIYQAVKFKDNITKYLDEARGFTDYTIE